MADFDTSGNSVQLDCSVDSGICVEVTKEDLKKKLQEFKRILFILERDKEARRLLRERLSRIAERKTTNKKKKDEQLCNVCFAPIDTEDSKTCIACYSCAKFVCRGGDKCSEAVPKDGEWICRLCSAKTDSYGKTSTWVEEQYSVQKATPAYAHPLRARSEIYIPLCDPNDSAFLYFESVSEAPSSTININQKQQIREYIEEVLAEMLGGSLDSTTVGPLTKSENYIPIGNEHELQGISHVRLRRLIESIIAETVRLPAFLQSDTTTVADPSSDQHFETLTLNGNSQCNGNAGQYFEPKKYQDLLATAVLNKIVDTHGNERHSESSPDLTSSAFDKNHNSLFPNKTDDSISSSSSIEPRSESSLTDPLHNINKGNDNSPLGTYGNFYADVANKNIEADNESVLSDFIASHMVPLPHISAETASDEEEEDEDFISVASSGRDAAWEDNWLFKKKRSSKISSSIGMLVPAPKEDIRALIGDKPTDEVSDLSEVGSDTDDSSLEMVSASLEPLNDRLVNQHLIGGKNTKVILDELVDQSSMISTSSLPENVPPYTETKNDFVVSNDGLSETETSKISISNCNVAIGNEAVNSDVSKPSANNNPTKAELSAGEIEISEEESIVPPPNDFTDDEKMRNLMAKFNEEQSNKTDSGDDNSSSMSPRSSISCALSDRISSESNQTDESTPTVIDTFGSSLKESGSDTDSAEDFSRDETANRDSTTDTATTTTSTKTFRTTNNVTNQSHINSPQSELRTASACSELQVLDTRSSAVNEEHVDDDLMKHLVPGSIAEREYKKWYNAVDMPNNPYSVEALKRRLSGGHERVIDLPNISPSTEEKTLMMPENESNDVDGQNQGRDYARYSRDYYINDAKHASGAIRKRDTPTTALPPSSSSTSSSPIELENRFVETLHMSPVKAMCHKLEKQCRTEVEPDLYTATPVRVEDDSSLESVERIVSQPDAVIVPLTTEAVRKLSSDTSSLPTTESLTPSEDSDTIRIYDLKKQETRIIKENILSVPKTPVKKNRPTELEITPTIAMPTASTSTKSSTPTSFKFMQPKRKLIDPSQVLSIDLDTTPVSPATTATEKTVIEKDVVHALPSVKALAQAFLLTSSHDTPKSSWRKARAKSPTVFVKPTTPIPVINVTNKPTEPTLADTSSHGSEDATIASDLSSLETDPPSKQDNNLSDTLSLARQSSQERPLSPVLVPGCLRNNIAFFENLKNK